MPNVEFQGVNYTLMRTWWVDLAELDDDQQAVITLPPDGNYLVLGPPGCGKTNLLLLRGKYLYKKGLHNIAVVVSTHTLQKFLTSGSKNYDFPSDRVLTHARWQTNLLHEYGVQIAPPDGYMESRAYLTAQIESLVASRNIKGRFDAILIDEAQDYSVDELALFKRVSKRIFAVADSKQQIYQGKATQAQMEGLLPNCTQLTFHYRNGLKICQVADAIAKDNDDYVPMVDGCKYTESGQESSVTHAQYNDLDDQIADAIKRVTSQTLAYPDEYIGIIAPKKEDMLRIADALYDSDLADLCVSQGGGESIEFTPDKPICICTIHAAKGLEFRATHILGAEKMKNFSNNKNLAFTAVTRTQTALAIYYSGTLPGFLDQALISLDGEPKDFELTDLFGGGN